MKPSLRWGLIIFGTALLIRLLYFAQLLQTPYVEYPLVDAQTFVTKAQKIAFETWWGEPRAYFHEPGYLYFLALIFRLFGYCPVAATVANFLLGSGTAVLTWLLAGRLFPGSPRVARLSGLAAAFCGPLIFFEGQLLRETLAGFLGLALFLHFERGYRDPSRRWALGTGLLLGLAAITRASSLVFLLAIALLLLRRGAAGGRALVWLGLGLCLTIGPVALRNSLMDAEPVLIASNWGINLWLGNNANMDTALGVRPGYGWEELNTWPERESGRPLTTSEKNYFYAGQAGAWMRAHPLDFLSLLVRKGFRFLRGFEPYRNVDPYFVADQVPLLKLLLWRAPGLNFPTGLLIPLALTGLWATRARWRALAAWYGFVVPAALAVVVFFVASRYRAPLLPFLIPFSVYGLRALRDGVRARRWAGPALCCLLIPILNLNLIEHDQVDYAEGCRQLGDAARRAGEPEQARRHYLDAIALNRDNPEYLNTLGTIHHQLGEFDEAREYYQRAQRVKPDFPFPAENLAHLAGDAAAADSFARRLTEPLPPATALGLAEQAIGAGAPRSALRFLDAAREHGGDPVAVFELTALACSRMGRNREAETRLTEGLAQYPREVRLLGLRGTVRSARERYRDAGRDLLAAYALAPGDPEIRAAVITVELAGGILPFVIDPVSEQDCR